MAVLSPPEPASITTAPTTKSWRATTPHIHQNVSFGSRSPMSFPPTSHLKEILAQSIPSDPLISYSKLPIDSSSSSKLSRSYALKLSSGRELELVAAPSQNVRLLRCENGLLSAEAGVIHFLQESVTDDSALADRDVEHTDISLVRAVLRELHVHNSDSENPLGPYSIFSSARGSLLSNSKTSLTNSEKANIQSQLIALGNSLASISCTAMNFGPALSICPPLEYFKDLKLRGEGPSKTWTEAFTNMFESILRDGEDTSVLLPYHVLREHLHRHSAALDEITVPRLCILNLFEESNVLIERDLDPRNIRSPTSQLHKTSGGNVAQNVRVTGLRDWSQAIFGDPLICSVEMRPIPNPSDVDEEIAANIETRKALYECYAASKSIVTGYYRPKLVSSLRELEARRRLMIALRVLGGENDDFKRLRSNSDYADVQEQENAKRLKRENISG